MDRCLMCKSHGEVEHTSSDFSTRWREHWHAGAFPNSAYGNAVPIARMRRGKYVMIPAKWRGQARTQPKNKRRNEARLPRELTLQEQRAPTIEEFYA